MLECYVYAEGVNDDTHDVRVISPYGMSRHIAFSVTDKDIGYNSLDDALINAIKGIRLYTHSDGSYRYTKCVISPDTLLSYWIDLLTRAKSNIGTVYSHTTEWAILSIRIIDTEQITEVNPHFVMG